MLPGRAAAGPSQVRPLLRPLATCPKAPASPASPHLQDVDSVDLVVLYDGPAAGGRGPGGRVGRAVWAARVSTSLSKARPTVPGRLLRYHLWALYLWQQSTHHQCRACVTVTTITQPAAHYSQLWPSFCSPPSGAPHPHPASPRHSRRPLDPWVAGQLRVHRLPRRLVHGLAVVQAGGEAPAGVRAGAGQHHHRSHHGPGQRAAASLVGAAHSRVALGLLGEKGEAVGKVCGEGGWGEAVGTSGWEKGAAHSMGS